MRWWGRGGGGGGVRCMVLLMYVSKLGFMFVEIIAQFWNYYGTIC